ncbi:hypothetical protein DPMN_137740 [Dreissena polymorpha]|uniref:Uncharacterized protein n=1 Tax=Dreissena polymorpha TaxID=45954 RepID=A0A9D4JJ46_DREPO|nr:hypothetical protein DPMN_137740 [Dreissena polymorpha]
MKRCETLTKLLQQVVQEWNGYNPLVVCFWTVCWDVVSLCLSATSPWNLRVHSDSFGYSHSLLIQTAMEVVNRVTLVLQGILHMADILQGLYHTKFSAYKYKQHVY